MPNIDDEIRDKTEAFARELTVLVRRAALESVSAALGSSAAAVAAPVQVSATRGRGRPAKVAPAARPAPAARAPLSRKAAPRASGEKRPPAELARLTDKLGEYIKANPGLRIEPIGKALGAPTRELSLPIKKLLAAKRIRSEGHKRATEYYPT